MPKPKLLEIQNATIWRGSTCVFKNFDLEIASGEHVAILGPNGCGKTTLLRTINRELYPVAAANSFVRILGRERWNVWELRSHIGVVSNDLQQRYPPSTTAIEVVISGFHASIGIHGIVAEKVNKSQVEAAEQTLSDLGIGDYRDTPLKKMSTGQQRRCLLARSLVHQPDILIFDEPTAGLDFTASFDYLQRIRRLAQRGRSIVIVTHYLNEIPPEVDRIILLKDGRIVADGSKQDVLTAELLTMTYETAVDVHEINGYYLAYPGVGGTLKT